MKQIKILGSGCPNCQKLYEHAQAAAAQTRTEAQFEKVTDMKEILKFQVLSTPALVIDDQVVSAGKVLSVSEISKLL
jgi:small redox-active disulfide protein 2